RHPFEPNWAMRRIALPPPNPLIGLASSTSNHLTPRPSVLSSFFHDLTKSNHLQGPFMQPKTLPRVASNVYLPCAGCARSTYHRVLAHTSSMSAKTQCEIC